MAVLEAARYYAWDGAAARCESFLARGLAEDNAADILRVADELGAAALRRAAAHFCIMHFKEARAAFFLLASTHQGHRSAAPSYSARQESNSSLVRSACRVVRG